MKNILLLIAIVFAFSACQKAFINKGLIGKWKLTEYLADPGDGSGTWQKADPLSPQSIEFRQDESLIFSPGGIYDYNRYKITSDTTMYFFKGDDSISMRYRLSENVLIINPPCIEGCGQKYKAVPK